MLKLVCCLIASFNIFDVSNDSSLYIVKKKKKFKIFEKKSFIFSKEI